MTALANGTVSAAARRQQLQRRSQQRHRHQRRQRADLERGVQRRRPADHVLSRRHVFVRATVSDPFGSFDISSARITIIDPANVTQVNNQLMTAQGAPATCNSTDAATCMFQYQYTVPATPSLGAWTIRSHRQRRRRRHGHRSRRGQFHRCDPAAVLTMLKSSTVLSDPLNNTTNPKRIPLAVVRYDITVTNSGPGTVDREHAGDHRPDPGDFLDVCVDGARAIPVVFVNGDDGQWATLTTTPANVIYSSVGDTGPWTYTPVPDVDGFDAAVRAVRIAPAGS